MEVFYYDLVPKDPVENLKWRIRCRERALTDIKFRDALWQAAMSDVCWFMAFCCWGYDPRAKNKIVPFIPYPHQEKVFRKLDEAFDYTQVNDRTLDVLVDKARAQGGTFGYLWVDLRRWLRDPMFSAGYVTRNADLVDSKTDSDTVLWKVQFALNMLPSWMRPRYERNLSQHTFENKDNGSLLKGYSAGQDVAAGGRAAQPLDSLVMTPTGPKMMGEISPGDFVIGSDGKPTKVVSVHPLGEKQAFSVRFSDGSSTECCDDHLWTVTERWSRDSRKHYEPVTKPLRDLRHSLRADRSEQKAWNYQIPITLPIEFAENHLPIHPYVLGCLLGDGCFRHSSPTFTTADEEMANTIGELLPAGLSMIRCGELEYRISTGARRHGQINPLTNALRDMSLWMKTSHTKFIPDVYKYAASPNARLEMLRGLLDTDGWVHLRKRKTASAKVCYCSTSRQMIEDVRFIVQSLGGVVGMISTTQLKGKKYERTKVLNPKDVIYELRIAMPVGMNPFKLSRKKDKYVERSKYQPLRSIVSVEPSRITDVQCIRVEAENGLYLTDDCIVTHNTVFTMDEAGAKDFVSGGKDYSVMESLHDVSHYLRLVSARYVDQGVFHEACEAGGTEGGWHLVLDWKDHPVHSKHSYVVMDNVPKACKPEDAEEVAEYHKSKPNLRDLLEKKGFKYDGVVRSPWYDMRCVSWGTLVVTDRGLVPIQDVALNDCVWDGNMYVSHDGCVFQGWKETICSYQVGLTPDHPVLTVKGWKYAYEGFDRAEVWLPDGYRERYVETYRYCVLGSSMQLRDGSDCEVQRFDQRSNDKLWMPSQEHALQNSDLQFMGCNGAAMHEHKSSKVPFVWSKRNNGLREMERFRKLLYGYGDSSKGAYARPYRQQRELRTWQLSMGDSKATAEQPPKHHAYRNSEWIYSDSRSGTCCGHDYQRSTGPHQERLDGGCYSASTQNPKPVYDLLNCGPRRAFTVIDDCGRPLLVHNCLRKTARPQLIASQLDRNPKGAVGKVFTTNLLDRMKKMNERQPVWKGTPVFDSETLELKGLVPREDGPLSLWFRPGIDSSAPLGPFTLACDIASGGVGVFASNSIVSGIDDRTGEQVLEYVIKGLEPRPFSRIAVGLALWMRKAKLAWEDSGVSGGFAKEVMEVLYYGNIYFRNVTQLGTQKKSRKPGFPCRDVDKADMFEQFALAMEQGKYIPRSSEMIMECGEYEWDNGKIIHAPTKNKGATEKNHGDRAIAAAGSWLVYSADNIREKVDSDDENDKNPEYGSFLWRERQERRIVNSGSPDYGIRDVLRR